MYLVAWLNNAMGKLLEQINLLRRPMARAAMDTLWLWWVPMTFISSFSFLLLLRFCRLVHGLSSRTMGRRWAWALLSLTSGLGRAKANMTKVQQILSIYKQQNNTEYSLCFKLEFITNFLESQTIFIFNKNYEKIIKIFSTK